MTSDDLPSEYDAVVLGTGMTESIVAASLSRAGLSVLHLDRYDYYSGDWACFHFQALQEWIETHQGESAGNVIQTKPFDKTLIPEGQTVVNLCVNSNSLRNVKQESYVSEEAEKEECPETQTIVCDSNKSEVTKDSADQSSESPNTQDNSDPDSGNQTVKTDDNSVTSGQETDSALQSGINNGASVPADQQEGEVTPKSTLSGEDVVGESDEKESTEEEHVHKVQARKVWVFTEIKKLWRKFNIDLMPKVLFCRGPMVELLISSDVAKYCEFKTVSKVLTLLNGKLEQVPCSRSDVFGSKLVSMIEKRMMMKHLTFSLEFEKHEQQYQDFKDKPYKEFLQSQKLTPNIKHFIQHSIAMVTDEASTVEGLTATQRFLQSLGRYGNTAFLWPLYGSGELPQCFCRMCAVFGGVYCLRRTAQSMVLDAENKCQAIIDTEGQRLQTKWLILEASFASESLLSSPVTRYTSRAVLLTDRSLSGDSQDVTLLSLPVEGPCSPVGLLELPPSANCSPRGLYVVHLSSVCQKGAEQDFKSVIEQLFVKADEGDDSVLTECSKPRIQWALYFEMADTTQCEKHPDSPDNVFLVGGPNHQYDFAYSVSKAKEIFSTICPDQEFLPKAPNPEDIIWDDGGDKQTSGGGFSEGEAGVEASTSGDADKTTETTENSGEDNQKKDLAEAEVNESTVTQENVNTKREQDKSSEVKVKESNETETQETEIEETTNKNSEGKIKESNETETNKNTSEENEA